jgi:hypothetical protein
MNLTDPLSKYITYGEAIKSATAKRLGIDNTPNGEQLTCMIDVANKVFDPVREFIGGKLDPSSFFRSEILNAATTGSAKNSQHTKGQAIDIDCDTYGIGNNKLVFDFIKANLEFDQLIWEFGNNEQPDWVHVSYVKGKNRGNVLRASRNADGSTKYVSI